MMNYENIERYCKEQMSAEEKAAFETEMQNNSELEQEVHIYKENILLLENEYSSNEGISELKKNLNQLGDKHFSKEKPTQKGKVRRLFYAVSSAAAILICAVLLFGGEQDLYAEYSVHDELVVQTKGDSDAALLEGSRLFNSKDYAAAAGSLEAYLADNNDAEVYFSLGICKLETGNIQEAKQIFSSAEISNSVFKDKAEWYSVLCELKAEDEVAAKAIASQISSSSFYYKKAQSLLEDLD